MFLNGSDSAVYFFNFVYVRLNLNQVVPRKHVYQKSLCLLALVNLDIE